MGGIVSFIKSVLILAFILGMSGNLVECTGLVGREASKAHQHGGISFRWLNDQLQK
jgi:hypothetical protein